MISAKEVQHIAKLARISLDDSEILKFQKDFTSILEYFDMLREVDSASANDLIAPLASPLSNVSREDVAKAKDLKDAARLLGMAPEIKDGYLKVKSIL